VEDTPGCRLPARGDAALEIDNAEVGLGDHLDELGGEQRLGRIALEPLRDATPKHRVAPERELHSAKPCSP
jgi:hypothetical protein